MKYKQYLIIEPIGKPFQPDSVKIKVKKGMLRENIVDTLDVKETWTPGAKEKIYFFPGCSVPRFKVREKFSVTIKAKNATSAFIAPPALRGSNSLFVEYGDVYRIPENYAAKWLKDIYGEKDNKFIKYFSLIQNCEAEVLLRQGTARHRSFWNQPQDARNPNALKIWETQPYGEETLLSMNLQKESFFYPTANSAVEELNCPIYLQDGILKLLNQGSIIVDEEKYEELRLMCGSEDEENVILVMELMANSDYDKSFIYLLLLLKEFSTKFLARKELHHVNFKGLLHYFELDERKFSTSLTLEALTKTMKKLGRFTRSNVQRMTQFFALTESDINNSNYNVKRTVSDHFTVGPVLKIEAEHLLDKDMVSDADEIEIPEEDNNKQL